MISVCERRAVRCSLVEDWHLLIASDRLHLLEELLGVHLLVDDIATVNRLNWQNFVLLQSLHAVLEIR